MALAIHHLALLARDLDRSAAFYGGVLGMRELTRHFEASGALRSIWYELGGGAFLAVERALANPRMGKEDEPRWHVVALSIPVAEREAWRAKLSAAGHSVFRETEHTIYCRDPDGNILALSSYPTKEKLPPRDPEIA